MLLILLFQCLGNHHSAFAFCHGPDTKAATAWRFSHKTNFGYHKRVISRLAFSGTEKTLYFVMCTFPSGRTLPIQFKATQWDNSRAGGL